MLEATNKWALVYRRPAEPAAGRQYVTRDTVTLPSYTSEVRKFVPAVFMVKPGWIVDIIFKTYELFIYGDTNYNTNSFCKNLLTMAIPSPELVNYILSRLVCSCYYQYLHVLFREIHSKVVHIVVRVLIHSSF